MVGSMSPLAATAVGAGMGFGALLVVLGLRGYVVVPNAARPVRVPIDELLLRAALGGSAFAVALVATRWLVVGILAGALGAAAPSWLRARHRHQQELEQVDAIATWTEQLRDTLAAASGLEQAIIATATMPPPPLADPLRSLAARLEYDRLGTAVRRFADEVGHPLCDFVAAALLAASEHEARNIGALLGELADAARADAAMRTRVWVGRARLRTSVRVIAGVVAAFVACLLVFNRQYLAVYDTLDGQVVLAGVLLTFVGSIVGMECMGRLRAPSRFLARRDDGVPA
jgi:Flp pilus assembly protein TadB